VGARRLTETIEKTQSLKGLLLCKLFSYIMKLADNNLEDEGIRKISESIKKSKSLEILGIGRCNIGLDAIKHISNCLANSSCLKVLYLGIL